MSVPPGDWYEGDEFGRSLPTGELVLDAAAADALNYAVDELRRLGSLRASAPLSLGARTLSLDLAAVVYAKLGEGHTFTVQQFDATAGWTDAIAGYSEAATWASGGGTASTGQVVRLYNVAPGDWRYQYPKTCASVCFILQDSSGQPIAGATVTLTPDSGPTVTGTTDAGGIWCPGGLTAGFWYADVDLGTGYTSPERITLKLADSCCCQYTLAWTEGDPTPAPTPVACCKCDTTITIKAEGQCGLGFLSGVAVTITGAGGYSATQTTDGSSAGLTFVLPHVGGDYTVTAVWNGAQTASKTITVTPCNGYLYTFVFLDVPDIYVLGCAGPIAGARVEVVDLPAVTCTTAANGHCQLDFSHDVPPTPLLFRVTLPTGPSRTQAPGTGSPNPYNPCETIFNFVDKFCVSVQGCNNSRKQGATVVISGPEDFTCGTQTDGTCCVTPTVDWSGQLVQVRVSAPYYQTTVVNLAVPVNQVYPCSTAAPLEPLACYQCCPSCPDPVPTQVTITDVNGAHTGLVSNLGGYCGAVVCYAAPFSGRVDANCNTSPGTVHVQYTYLLVPGQPAKLGVAWLARDCTGTGGSGGAGYHPIDTTCATLASGRGVVPPFVLDEAQITPGAQCPANPLDIGGTMGDGGLSPNPVRGAVTVTDGCTNGPGDGASYVYYQQGTGDGLPDSVTVTFDLNPLWGDLAGTSVTLPRSGTTGDYESACLTSTTDDGHCDPGGPTEGFATVSLSLSSPGVVDATVQWTGGRQGGSGCGAGGCEYYGSASGTAVPEDDSPRPLLIASLTYSSGGSGSFTPAASTWLAEEWDVPTAPALPGDWTFGAGFATTTSLPGGLTPISSPNVLSNATAALQTAVYAATDPFGGDVTVGAALASAASTSSPYASVFARGSSLATPASLGGYECRLTWSGTNVTLAVYSWTSGTATSLGSVTAVGSLDAWYLVSLTCSGTTISATVQRQSDGYWLTAAGAWQSASATAISVTDSSVSGAGQVGLATYAYYDGTTSTPVLCDDFTAGGVSGGAVITLRVPSP